MIKRALYSIDENVLKDFNKYCKKNDLKKSTIVSRLIRTYLIKMEWGYKE